MERIRRARSPARGRGAWRSDGHRTRASREASRGGPLLAVEACGSPSRRARRARPLPTAFPSSSDVGGSLAIVGASGAGKSTLLAALVGSCRAVRASTRARCASAAKGSSARAPRRCAACAPRRRRRVPGRARRVRPRRSDRRAGRGRRSSRTASPRARARERARAPRALPAPDPAGGRRAAPHELSGGMRQHRARRRGDRVQPALLLADRPTGALDPTLALQVLDLFDARTRARPAFPRRDRTTSCSRGDGPSASWCSMPGASSSDGPPRAPSSNVPRTRTRLRARPRAPRSSRALRSRRRLPRTALRSRDRLRVRRAVSVRRPCVAPRPFRRSSRARRGRRADSAFLRGRGEPVSARPLLVARGLEKLRAPARPFMARGRCTRCAASTSTSRRKAWHSSARSGSSRDDARAHRCSRSTGRRGRARGMLGECAEVDLVRADERALRAVRREIGVVFQDPSRASIPRHRPRDRGRGAPRARPRARRWSSSGASSSRSSTSASRARRSIAVRTPSPAASASASRSRARSRPSRGSSWLDEAFSALDAPRALDLVGARRAPPPRTELRAARRRARPGARSAALGARARALRGRVVEEGPTEQVLRARAIHYTQALVAAAPTRARGPPCGARGRSTPRRSRCRRVRVPPALPARARRMPHEAPRARAVRRRARRVSVARAPAGTALDSILLPGRRPREYNCRR